MYYLLSYFRYNRVICISKLDGPSPSLPTAMEEKSRSSSALFKLEEQLTCSVCLEIYTNPKTLPCLHSFCQDCLFGLISRDVQQSDKNEDFISCPSCRLRVDIPGGVSSLPVAFHINNLKETYSQLKDKEDIEHSPTKTSSDPTQPLCSTHKKPLDTFCENCDMIVCFTCVKQKHREHDYDLIVDSYRKQCQILNSCLSPIKKKTVATKQAFAALVERENQIKQQGESIKEDIHSMVEEIISALHQSASQLIKEVDTATEGKLNVLAVQKKSAEKTLGVLNEIQEYVEQSLENESPENILSSKKELMEQMSEVSASVNLNELCPLEKADLTLVKDDKILSSSNQIGDTHITFSNLKQSKIVNVGPVKYLKEKKVSFSITLEGPDSSPLSIPLSVLNCQLLQPSKNEKTIATVTSSVAASPGVYEVQCSPLSNGHHKIIFSACDVNLESASITIPFSPYLETISPVYTISGLSHPWGVSVAADGNIMVTDNWAHTVMTFGPSQQIIGGNGAIKFLFPRGIAITQDNFILITDNDKVQKLNMNGQRIASVGKEGNGARRFSYPAGIAISPINRLVYIADRSNHRVQVLNPDLTFSHSFGSMGGSNGQFQYPTHISIDSKGSIYVTDHGNRRVQKFLVDEKFAFCITGNGVDAPSGIAVDQSDLVYVGNEGGQFISVFTTEGEFIRSISLKGVSPKGLTFDKKGTLYVCSNKEILVYGM